MFRVDQHQQCSACLCAAGLDAVMVLETHDDGLAIKRALGRRVDPQSGRVYHLEFDPPPPKEPGLADRLKVASHLYTALRGLLPVLH